MVYAIRNKEVAATMKMVFAPVWETMLLELNANVSLLDVALMMLMTIANLVYPPSP